MDYDECPVDVMNKWDTTKGTMVLVLQPPPPNYKPDKTRRKRPTDNKRPLNQVAKPKPPSKSGSVEPQPNSTFQIGDGVQVRLSTL